MIHRRDALALGMALAGVLAACGGSDEEPKDLPMQRISALWANTDVQQNYVLRTEADWQAAWARHLPILVPPPSAPRVDFSRDMVLGVSRGTGSSGCDGLSITKVVEEAAELRVDFARAAPPPSGIACATVMVSLTDFVVVRASAKPVRFQQVAPG